MQFFPNLSHLELTNSYFNEELLKLKNLQYLNLEGTKFRSDFLLIFANNCENLAHLKIYKINIQEDIMIWFLEKTKNHLKSLYVEGTVLSDAFYQFLPDCSKLEELGIRNAKILKKNNIHDISKLHNLKVLELYVMHKLTSEDYISLFENNNLAQLTKLGMVSYKMSLICNF